MTRFSFVPSLRDFFLHIVYPSFCLHCQDSLSKGRKILCSVCIELLQPINHTVRCPRCFSEDYHPLHQGCSTCAKRQNIYKYAAVFEYIGPIVSILKQLKYSSQHYLSKACGAYMAAYLLEIGWPIPDVIVPVPISPSHWIKRGYNQSSLLGKSIGKILSRKTQNALKRTSLDYSQTKLNHKQREEMRADGIRVKNKQNLMDKNILIVDDVLTTGKTLESCASALLEECPSSIYALTLCIVG